LFLLHVKLSDHLKNSPKKINALKRKSVQQTQHLFMSCSISGVVMFIDSFDHGRVSSFSVNYDFTLI